MRPVCLMASLVRPLSPGCGEITSAGVQAWQPVLCISTAPPLLLCCPGLATAYDSPRTEISKYLLNSLTQCEAHDMRASVNSISCSSDSSSAVIKPFLEVLDLGTNQVIVCPWVQLICLRG